MFYRLAADSLVVLHLLFILFVVCGALLVLKWRWLVVIHLPAVVWAALLEFQAWRCPLTPLEQQLRVAGGEAGYRGGFIEHYLLPLIYPADLTREFQVLLGLFVVSINIVIYALIFKTRH